MQALPSQGHGQSWDPQLQSGLWGSPVFPSTCNLSRVCVSRLPAVCQPPGGLKRGQASQYLSPGGDFQSPHYCSALTMGRCLIASFHLPVLLGASLAPSQSQEGSLGLVQ